MYPVEGHHACREASRHFIHQGGGSIVIVGSTARCAVLPTETSYRVSKAGLKPYMELLAVELAPFGIRVNMITPGYLPSKVSAHVGKREGKILGAIPMRRAGKPEDWGHAAVFLLSEKLSPYTTGSELFVDGGFHVYPNDFFSDEEVRQMNL